jgi:hypothetical protein
MEVCLACEKYFVCLARVGLNPFNMLVTSRSWKERRSAWLVWPRGNAAFCPLSGSHDRGGQKPFTSNRKQANRNCCIGGLTSTKLLPSHSLCPNGPDGAIERSCLFRIPEVPSSTLPAKPAILAASLWDERRHDNFHAQSSQFTRHVLPIGGQHSG